VNSSLVFSHILVHPWPPWAKVLKERNSTFCCVSTIPKLKLLWLGHRKGKCMVMRTWLVKFYISNLQVRSCDKYKCSYNEVFHRGDKCRSKMWLDIHFELNFVFFIFLIIDVFSPDLLALTLEISVRCIL
jgi:hypothetical protein